MFLMYHHECNTMCIFYQV